MILGFIASIFGELIFEAAVVMLIVMFWKELLKSFFELFFEFYNRRYTLKKDILNGNWDSFIGHLEDGFYAVLQRNFYMDEQDNWHKSCRVVKISPEEVPERIRRKAANAMKGKKAQEITEDMREELELYNE